MVKTDNHNPAAKLELRRYFLSKYHGISQPSVFDCCQGSAKLWTKLQEEFAVGQYWGVDLKPKKGRLKIDSVRILEQTGWMFDVIDVDTYGAPWKHFIWILKKASKPVTVFLTIGQNKMVGGFQGKPPKEITTILNIPPSTPPTIAANLWDYGCRLLLAQALRYGKITEAVEAVSDGNARYIGLRFEPKKNGLPIVDAIGKPKHRKANKEQCNV